MLLLNQVSSTLTFLIPLALTLKALQAQAPQTTPPQSFQFLLNYWIYYVALGHIVTYFDASPAVQVLVTIARTWMFYGHNNNIKAANRMLISRVCSSSDLSAFERRYVDPILRRYVFGSGSRNVSVLQFYLNRLAEKPDPVGPHHKDDWLPAIQNVVRVILAAANSLSSGSLAHHPRQGSPTTSWSPNSNTPTRNRSLKKSLRTSISSKSLRAMAMASGNSGSSSNNPGSTSSPNPGFVITPPQGSSTINSPRRRSHRNSDPPYPAQRFTDIPSVEQAIEDDIMEAAIQRSGSQGIYNDFFNDYSHDRQQTQSQAQPRSVSLGAPAPVAVPQQYVTVPPPPPYMVQSVQHSQAQAPANNLPAAATPGQLDRFQAAPQGFFGQTKHMFQKREPKVSAGP